MTKLDARHWSQQIESAESYYRHYTNECDRIDNVYVGKSNADYSQSSHSTHYKSNYYNILYANVDTLRPFIYNSLPGPVVSRRYAFGAQVENLPKPLEGEVQNLPITQNILQEFSNELQRADQSGKRIAQALERLLDLNIKSYDFDGVLEKIRDDYIKFSRGIGWIDFCEDEIDDETKKQIVEVSYVQRKDFLMCPARSWDEVSWVARRHWLTEESSKDFQRKKRIKKNLSEILSFSHTTEGYKEDVSQKMHGEKEYYSPLWEIWSKDDERVYWWAPSVQKGSNAIILEEEDPYSLDGFYPTPRPPIYISASDSMLPVPEYRQYMMQAIELENVSRRITRLTESIKVSGAYLQTGDNQALSNMLSSADLTMTPLTNMPPGSKMNDLIEFLPIQPSIVALQQLYVQRQQILDVIFQITGISDIVRGVTAASETATAQQIKGNFAGSRIGGRRKPFERYVRDLLRMKAEIMAEKFDASTMTFMTKSLVTREDAETLKSDRLRSYVIDVNTEEMVAADDQAEKRDATQFLGQITQLMQVLLPLAQQSPGSVQFVQASLKFVARKFRAGREFEDAVDNMADSLAQPQQPQPSEAEIEIAKIRAKGEVDLRKQREDHLFEAKESEKAREFKVGEDLLAAGVTQ